MLWRRTAIECGGHPPRIHVPSVGAALGYAMMARSESFVSATRVPSHLVLSMAKGASIDQLVQTAGRATFQRLHVLTANGWNLDQDGAGRVTVLMPQDDYKVLQASPNQCRASALARRSPYKREVAQDRRPTRGSCPRLTRVCAKGAR